MDFWANEKPPFWIVSSARELQSSISAINKNFFLLLLNLSFVALFSDQLPEFHKLTQIVSKSLKNRTSIKQPRLIKQPLVPSPAVAT